MHPRKKTAFKTSLGLSILYIGQPEPPPFNYFVLSAMKTYRGVRYQLHSFFNSATDTIFDQLHASAALRSGNNSFTHSVRDGVVSRPSLDNMANCILYFSLVNIFWQVFYCQLKR